MGRKCPFSSCCLRASHFLQFTDACARGSQHRLTAATHNQAQKKLIFLTINILKLCPRDAEGDAGNISDEISVENGTKLGCSSILNSSK